VFNLRQVTLKEKLNAQVENIEAIANGDMPLEVKIKLLEGQRDYIHELLTSLIDNIKQTGGN